MNCIPTHTVVPLHASGMAGSRDANNVTKTLLPHRQNLSKHEAITEGSREETEGEAKRKTGRSWLGSALLWYCNDREEKDPFLPHSYVNSPNKFWTALSGPPALSPKYEHWTGLLVSLECCNHPQKSQESYMIDRPTKITWSGKVWGFPKENLLSRQKNNMMWLRLWWCWKLEMSLWVEIN